MRCVCFFSIRVALVTRQFVEVNRIRIEVIQGLCGCFCFVLTFCNLFILLF